MSKAHQAFTFVSGKGGVGKTLLAANFAYCSSTVKKTLLVDLDFQNQGASGLLSEYLRPSCANAADIIRDDTGGTLDFVKVREKLYFVPAFDPGKTSRFGSQTFSASLQSSNLAGLATTFESLTHDGGFDTIILDCHGGLDDVSFAAFIYSDTTFVVTEADKVTFSGTLELLDFYVERARATVYSEAGKNLFETGMHEPIIEQRVRNVQDNHLRFLVSRVSDKFQYEGLKNILAAQFETNVPVLKAMNQGFSFFPSDPLLFESFSEYPFFVELMPESIFSQKMELLYTQASGASPALKRKSRFYRVFERIRPDKLDKMLRSSYDIRARAVFSFIGAIQVVVTLVVLLGIGVNVYALLHDNSTSDAMKYFRPYAHFDALLTAIFLLFLMRFNFKVAGFFRDRLRYEWRLYSKGARTRSAAVMLRIVRSFLFRFFLITWAGLYLLGALFYVGYAIYIFYSR